MEEKKIYTVFHNGTFEKTKNRYPSGAGLFRHDFSLENLAGEIISSYHPHLKEARIAYLLRPGKWKSKGRAVTGRALVAPPLWRLLSGFDLVLILNEMIYRGLDEKGKRALLDHELSHFAEPTENILGEKSWSIREHDVQEFSEVVRRHGICFSNLSACASMSSARQLDLESLQEAAKADDTSDNEEEIGADVFTQGPEEKITPHEDEENLFYEELQ